MLGLHESFPYFQCAHCQTIQIDTVPAHSGRYYAAGYRSAAENRIRPQGMLWRVFVGRPSLRGRGIAYRFAEALEISNASLTAIGRSSCPRNGSVLDVGCGRGALLLGLRELGFTDLTGVDRYVDIADSYEVRIIKGTVWDLPADRKFDLIMVSHVLEHVENPEMFLSVLRSHMKDDGVAIIRTPVVSGAYSTYGANWFQLDAPRHLHILSESALALLFDRAGLALRDSYFDSSEAQFRISELYAAGKNIPKFGKGAPALVEELTARIRRSLSPRHWLWRQRAAELNASRAGDQGVFYAMRLQGDSATETPRSVFGAERGPLTQGRGFHPNPVEPQQPPDEVGHPSAQACGSQAITSPLGNSQRHGSPDTHDPPGERTGSQRQQVRLRKPLPRASSPGGASDVPGSRDSTHWR